MSHSSTRGLGVCYTEKATPARHRPEQHHACANRRKQSSPNTTKSCSNPTPLRKRQNNPTNGHSPRRMKPTHTRLTYTRMRPHAPSHQAGDHPVPAHTERHNPSKVWTQRQSGFPPRCLVVCHRATCTFRPKNGTAVLRFRVYQM